MSVMINRDSWGYSYLIVRGEILGFVKNGLLRKHLTRMFSLITNEFLGSKTNGTVRFGMCGSVRFASVRFGSDQSGSVRFGLVHVGDNCQTPNQTPNPKP